MDVIDEYIQAGYGYAHAYKYYQQIRKELRFARQNNYEFEIDSLTEQLDFYKSELDTCKNDMLEAAKDLLDQDDEDECDEEQQ